MEVKRLGLIAGNGRFPLLVLEAAQRRGIPVTVAAIQEETTPDIARFATPGKLAEAPPAMVDIHWMGVGQLGKMLRVFRSSGVDKVLLAGQVKHVRIFSPGALPGSGLLKVKPDLRMLRLLLSLPRKNTASLIGGVIRTLEAEGFEVLDSTALLEDLIPGPGTLTLRAPTPEEARDIAYGTGVAREIARLDLGQTVVVKHQAVVAIEAMEGTDETVRRACRLVGGQPLTVVKVARPKQDLRLDVPVMGLDTLRVFEECKVTAAAVDAGRTLLLDRPEFIRQADRIGMALIVQGPTGLESHE